MIFFNISRKKIWKQIFFLENIYLTIKYNSKLESKSYTSFS